MMQGDIGSNPALSVTLIMEIMMKNSCDVVMKSSHAVAVGQKERDDYAKDVLEFFINNPDETFHFIWTGDMCIWGTRDDTDSRYVEINDFRPVRCAYVNVEHIDSYTTFNIINPVE